MRDFNDRFMSWRFFLPGKTFLTFAAWLAIASACGSRTVIDYGDFDETGGANGQGGTTSTTTSSSVTTTTTVGTATGTGSTGSTGVGGFVTGGTTGVGGSGPSCQNVDCAAFDCAPGTTLTVVPGLCCPVCQPCNVPCPGIACASGSHYEVLPGQCCGTCVPDPQMNCDVGKKEYTAQRTQLLDKFGSVFCSRDSECVVATEQNQCFSTCGVALPLVTAADWKSITTSTAEKLCASCKPMPTPPCVRYIASCVTGRCVLIGVR
jgi:hypothetical protein